MIVALANGADKSIRGMLFRTLWMLCQDLGQQNGRTCHSKLRSSLGDACIMSMSFIKDTGCTCASLPTRYLYQIQMLSRKFTRLDPASSKVIGTWIWLGLNVRHCSRWLMPERMAYGESYLLAHSARRICVRIGSRLCIEKSELPLREWKRRAREKVRPTY